jgi:hypothetical protein
LSRRIPAIAHDRLEATALNVQLTPAESAARRQMIGDACTEFGGSISTPRCSALRTRIDPELCLETGVPGIVVERTPVHPLFVSE